MLTIRHLAPLCLLAFAGSLWAVDSPATKKDTKPATTSTTSTANASSQEKGRDWSRIDTDKDNLISPEEVEKYLAENPGPLKK